MKSLKVIAAVVVFVLTLSNAFAQNAVVTGTVSDASGALIPGVEVTATNVGTGIVTTTVSNESGAYNFQSLQPGTYRLTASLSGFNTAAYNDVRLGQTQQARFNFTLQVGALSTAVEVTADVDLTLATTSASVGNVFAEHKVSALPLQTRNVLDLFKVMAGTGGETGQGTGSNGGIGENFDGQRITEVNTTRDGLVTSSPRFLMSSGVETATFVSPDLVEEVQVVTGSIDAEAGRGPGQVRLQTRSGTNGFHGALFYTNNNKALNANSWFANRNSTLVPWTNRNQFGGRLGGPIIKKKAFFFVLIESGRYLEKQSFVANVLTKEARQGIFRFLTAGAPAGQPAALARQNGNANSVTPSVDKNGNVLSSAAGQTLFLNSGNLFGINPDRTSLSTSPWLLDLLKKMPEPNDWTVGDGLNTAGFRWARPVSGLADPRSTSTNTNRDTLNARFDYQLNDANKLSFIMTREKNWALQSNIANYPAGTNGPLKTFPNVYSGAWTWTVSPTTLNEFRLGRNMDYLVDRPPQFAGWDGQSLDTIDQQKLTSLPQPNGYLLQVTPTNFPLLAPFNSASLRDIKSPRYQVSDTISWIRGIHAFKAGGDWQGYWADGWSTLGGAVPFTSFGQGGSPVTTAQVTSGFPNLAAGDVSRAQSILNDVTGSIASLTQLFFINSPTQANWQDYKDDFRRRRNFRQNDWSVFFKDTWQTTKNLTLTLGLRYDKYGVVYEQAGLAPRTKGGQSGIFGISGKDFGSWFSPGASGGALTEIEFVGKNSPNSNRGMYNDDWNNFAPSVGLSWNVPWLNRRTVVRGGYGVNYSGAGSMFLYETCCGRSPGSTLTVQSIPTTYQSLTTITLPLTPPVPPYGIVPLTDRVSAFGTWSDNTRTPYVQNWNLSITRELARNLTLAATYVGNKSVKLYQPIELNEPNIYASVPALSNETFIQAFNITRAGGQSTLFDRMLRGIDLDGTGALPAVDGTATTGSSVLRRFTQTQGFIARGEVAGLAKYLNSTTAGNAAGDLTTGNLLRKNGFPENFFMVNPQFGSAQLWGNNNQSNYHSLQVQLTRHLTSGVSGQFTYTWAKSLGIPLWSGYAGDGNSGATAATTLDPRNRNADHGRLSFDRTHNINANGTWELPFGSNKRFLSGAPKWIDRVAGNWELSGVLSVNSGYPRDVTAQNGAASNAVSLQTVGSNFNQNFANVLGNFPRATGNVTVGDRVVNYFADYKVVDAIPAAAGPQRDAAIATLFGADWNNLSAANQAELRTLASAIGNYKNLVDSSGNVVLGNPGPGKVGNLGPGWVNTPGRLGLDMALMKRVQITEGIRFTIRGDAINILNRPQWGAPITDLNSPDFGLITQATGSRTITINARIDF